MLVSFQTILVYLLFSCTLVFVMWLSLVSIIYQNKQCYSTDIQKYNYIPSNSSTIDSRLKLNHFTVLGTHNSYHQASLVANYNHPSVDEQLSSGIRQLELDIHLMKDHNLVYHIQLFDDKTNCYCLNECLMKIVTWFNRNPTRYPIYLFIEIKQKFYEDLATGLGGGVKCAHFQQLKDEILQAFPLNMLILPSQIQGNQTSLKLALKKQRTDESSGDYIYHNYGWPPLAQSLGKILPVFIDDSYNIAVQMYSQCDPLQTFFFIAQTNIDLSYSSIISISNPIKDEQILINGRTNGLILRILLGYGNNNLDDIYQKTKSYGIHLISSDSVQCNDTSLCQDLARDFFGSNVLCNSYSAPSFCNSSMTFL